MKTNVCVCVFLGGVCLAAGLMVLCCVCVCVCVCLLVVVVYKVYVVWCVRVCFCVFIGLGIAPLV